MKSWVIVLASAAGLGLLSEDAFADRSRHRSSSAHQHRHHHVQPHRHHHSHGSRIVVVPSYWNWPRHYYVPAPVYVAPVIAAPVVVPSMNSGYWYFCPDSRTYYPYVVECGSGWMAVVPGAAAPPSN